jgi:hypothetical protein
MPRLKLEWYENLPGAVNLDSYRVRGKATLRELQAGELDVKSRLTLPLGTIEGRSERWV